MSAVERSVQLLVVVRVGAPLLADTALMEASVQDHEDLHTLQLCVVAPKAAMSPAAVRVMITFAAFWLWRVFLHLILKLCTASPSTERVEVCIIRNWLNRKSPATISRAASPAALCKGGCAEACAVCPAGSAPSARSDIASGRRAGKNTSVHRTHRKSEP